MRLKFFIPLLAFVVLAISLGVGLTLKPRDIPSALIGEPVPEFSLPGIPGHEDGLSTADFGNGEVVLVNVFASWCIPCRQEHPLFMELARTGGIKIYGLNQRDKVEDAVQWLATFGDPYDRVGSDLDGRAGIDWGVYGVPETFIVDGRGHIIYKRIGVVTRSVLDKEILPRVQQARRQAAEAAETK